MVAVLALTAAAGCTTAPDRASSGPPSTPGAQQPTASASTSSTSTTSPSRTSAGPTGAPAPPSCAERTAAALSEPQRVGQLLMVGLQPTGSSRALAGQVASRHLGGVIYLGGWEGSGTVSTVSKRLQAATTQQATGGVRLLVAADQEGGRVQQLRGPGFTRLPSARTQATFGAKALQSSVTAWSKELVRAGVNVNLAPVADTVPTSLGAGNDPIGRHRRDYNPGDPAANGRDVTAFVKGSLAADVAPTVKHFPGLGRVTGNTDFSASGITDPTASATDAYLEPFAAGIRAGAPLVMVSSARYPRLDSRNQAMFSRAVVTGLLRERLGFRGVVITDDVGAAKAVAGVPVGERATRFVAAGGDIVLTAQAAQAPTMIAAIRARMRQSPEFTDQVEAAVVRVLELKVRLGLVRCAG